VAYQASLFLLWYPHHLLSAIHIPGSSLKASEANEIVGTGIAVDLYVVKRGEGRALGMTSEAVAVLRGE